MRKMTAGYTIILPAIAVVFSFLLIPSMARAEWRDELPDGLRVTGRYFYAGGYTFERPFLDDDTFAEVNLRLNGIYRIDPDWKLHFSYQADFTYMQMISMYPDQPDGLIDLRWPIDGKSNWRAGHALDRLYLNYRGDDFTLDIGRQRMAWGTTQLLSFLDMFHPIRPGNPFVPEQPGTDGIRIQIQTGMTSGWDILYAWLDKDGNEAVAARYHDVFGEFESAFSTGRIGGEDFVAVETSGDINDIGVRIEAAWRDTIDGDKWQVALESDYAPNSLTYLSGEIFYNGPGAARPVDYDPEFLTGNILYPARWYAGVNCSHNNAGLTTLGFIGIMNLTDDSWFSDLSIQHSLSDESDLRLGYQHYEGDLVSEYGALPDMIYVIVSSYF